MSVNVTRLQWNPAKPVGGVAVRCTRLTGMKNGVYLRVEVVMEKMPQDRFLFMGVYLFGHRHAVLPLLCRPKFHRGVQDGYYASTRIFAQSQNCSDLQYPTILCLFAKNGDTFQSIAVFGEKRIQIQSVSKEDSTFWDQISSARMTIELKFLFKRVSKAAIMMSNQ
eukprot:TRINITY_DN82185_c0_g1_i1.p1 TRINITY_DN82185_c0_g1~~TRINITY_DN82185_c0_g1_i1.p1  ORF type:complete len:166 (+),score=31.95 TRINITY_DN82185_c0_g1_i1:292-789(+)